MRSASSEETFLFTQQNDRESLESPEQIALVQVENSSQQAGSHFTIGNFGGHSINRVDSQAHGQRAHLSVEDFAALRRHLDSPLLLALRPAQQLQILEDFKLIQAGKKAQHPQGKDSAEDQAAASRSRWTLVRRSDCRFSRDHLLPAGDGWSRPKNGNTARQFRTAGRRFPAGSHSDHLLRAG